MRKSSEGAVSAPPCAGVVPTLQVVYRLRNGQPARPIPATGDTPATACCSRSPARAVTTGRLPSAIGHRPGAPRLPPLSCVTAPRSLVVWPPGGVATAVGSQRRGTEFLVRDPLALRRLLHQPPVRGRGGAVGGCLALRLLHQPLRRLQLRIWGGRRRPHPTPPPAPRLTASPADPRLTASSCRVGRGCGSGVAAGAHSTPACCLSWSRGGGGSFPVVEGGGRSSAAFGVLSTGRRRSLSTIGWPVRVPPCVCSLSRGWCGRVWSPWLSSPDDSPARP